jgi:hypothetical protein
MKCLFVFTAAMTCALTSHAFVSLAGTTEISALSANVRQFDVKLVVANYPTSVDTVLFDYGDGNYQFGLLANNTSCVTVTNGFLVHLQYIHAYSPGMYLLKITAGKRMAGISNIANSDTTDFELFSGVIIDPNVGANSIPVADASVLTSEFVSGLTQSTGLSLYDSEGDSISSFVTSSCPGYSFPATVGGGSFIYDQSTQIFSWNPNVAGVYSVMINVYEWMRMANGNYINISWNIREYLIDVDNQVGTSEEMVATSVAYPNPANYLFNLQFAGSHQRTVFIYDAFGREISAAETLSNGYTVNVYSFAEGIYFYSIIEEGELKAHGKFAVRH